MTVLYSIIGILILLVARLYFENYLLINKLKPNPMATFQDLQTAASNNTAAASALENAVTNYVAAHSADITAAEADEVVNALNASTESINKAAAALQPVA
jgi:hypothetical protein